MAVRSACLLFVQHVFSDQGMQDVLTVPEGRTYIVKEAAVQQSSGAARTVALGVRRATVSFPFVRLPALAVDTLSVATGRFTVLEAGDVVYVQNAGAGAATLRVRLDGADLVGIAP